MALSWSEQILPAGSQTVPVEIAYLDRAYIHLYVNNVEQTDFTWDSDVLIRFGTQLEEASTITIVRRTERSYLYIMFAEGAAFIKENLDTQNTQFLHLAQELVEGRAIEGFYGDIGMNGYKITNLGAGTALTDAVNVGQLNEVNDKVNSILGQEIVDTVSYPWYVITSEQTNTVSPPYTFNNAAVYINGVCQTPGYSYSISDNVITLADPVSAGTHVFCRLGEDVPNEQGYATAASLSSAVTTLEASIAALSSSTSDQIAANHDDIVAIQTDITTINGTLDTFNDILSTGVVSVAHGGTGSTTAAAARTALGTAASGANSDITSLTGLTTALTVAQGGTGATTAAGARTSLGAAMSGINPDITQLTGLSGGITGLTTGVAAGTGKIGEVLSTEVTTAVPLTTGVTATVATLSLPAGNWMISGGLAFVGTSVTTAANAVWAGNFTDTAGSVNSSTFQRSFKPYIPLISPAAALTTAGAVPSRTFNLTATTTIYLNASAVFGGTLGCTGEIVARRVS